MNSVKISRCGGLVIFLAAGVIGCTEETSPVVDEELMCEQAHGISKQSFTLRPQDVGNGSGGTNGVNTYAFHQIVDELVSAMQVPLSNELESPILEPGVVQAYPVSQKIKDAFLNSKSLTDDNLESGEAIRQWIFRHVVQCGLQKGVRLIDGDMNYDGNGMLTTTTPWFHRALDLTNEEDRGTVEDLFACMAPLLNPLWKGIPIFLSGPSVSCQDSSSEYKHVEAFWAVHFDGRPRFFVWPVLDVGEVTSCGNDADYNPWEYRVCGSGTKDCGLTTLPKDQWKIDCTEVEPKLGCDPQKDPYNPMMGFDYECTIIIKDANGADVGVKKRVMRSALRDLCYAGKLFCPAPQ